MQLVQWLQNNLPPFGSLDAPADGDSYQGDTLQIRGWGLDNRSISNIYAVIDESQQIPLSLGNARADVDTAWPGYTNGATSGFETTIDVSGLHHDPNCGHTIEIFAQDSDGNTRSIARNQFFLEP